MPMEYRYGFYKFSLEKVSLVELIVDPKIPFTVGLV